jgi:RHS repeat-associated protein
MRKYSLFILGLLFGQAASSQLSITGNTCVATNGTQYQYTISGNWTSSTTMTWSLTNGVIAGTSNAMKSGTPVPTIYVIWNSGVTSGKVTLTTSNPTGSTYINISTSTSLVGGTISNSSQTIAYNTIPATINCSVASGGGCSPSYAYQWQYSPDNITWADTSGMISQNLSFSQGLKTTTYFRRKVTESVSSTISYSGSATVFVNPPPIVIGTSFPTYQLTNTYSGSPIDLLAPAATGGSTGGPFTYQWQQLIGSTWTDISSANGLSFNPGPGKPTNTTYYRLKVTDGIQTIYGTVDTIASQTVSINGATECWTGQSVTYSCIVSGASNYNWSLPVNASITSGGTTSPTFNIQWTAPSSALVPVYLSYVVGGVTQYLTLYVHIKTIPLYAGVIWNANQLIEQGSNLSLSASPAKGGTCNANFGYQWEQSTDNITFTPMSSQTAVTLSASYYTFPANTVYYRRKTTCSGSSNGYTDTATLNIYAYFDPGTVTAGNTDSIPWNTKPLPITGTVPTGGASTTYSYQWQYSYGGTYYDVKNNGFGKDFQPDNQATTIWLRRAVTNANTTRTTSAVKINVKVLLFDPGTIVSSSTIVSPGTTVSLTGTAATGGTSASYYYQWQQSSDEVNWTNIAGATAQNYTTGSLSKTTYFRRYVTNNAQSGYSTVNAVFNEVKVKVVAGLGSIITPTTAVQATADTSIHAVPVNPYTLSGITPAKVNYVRNWDVSKAGITTATAAKALTSITDAQQVTAYFDDLGRPIQTVAEDATPDQKDLVTVQNYDILGRQVQQYLPYTDNTSTGDFKTDPTAKQPAFYNTLYNNKEGYYYSNTVYEKSPLNRPLKQTAPGNSWTGNNVGVRTDYAFNTVSDSVVNWTISTASSAYPVNSGYLAPGALVLVVTTDEHENKVMEYKDKEGKVILKKVQLNDTLFNGHYGWMCTYYVYDVLNHLRYVVPPNAVSYALSNSWSLSNSTVQNELCFQYQYDSLGRLTNKKVPGSGWVYTVYDKRNRAVYTQDSSLRAANQWMGTLYDDINRPIETGMLTYSGGFAALQTYVNGNTGNYTYSSATVTGNAVPTLLANLYVAGREQGRALYQATNSIILDNGFTSETGAVFTAEIDTPVVNGSFSNTVTFLDNPVPSGYTFTPLTITNYDDYTATTKSYTSANNSLVDDGSNSYAYALPSAAYPLTEGLVTSTKVRILQSPTDITQGAWIENVNFYDDKGRAIQVQRTNNTGANDTVITQYSFAGMPLKTLSCEAKAGANLQTVRVLTKMNYDATWRLSTVTKQVGTSTPVTIATNVYNQLGQLVTKRQGQKHNNDFSYNSNALDTLDYTYNIRGWMAGINRGYANPQAYTTEASSQGSRWFGMELAYDFGFTSKQLNGNIAGTVWRNQSDGQQRSYGFTYDNANRLTEADFTQNAGSNTWNTSAGVDFSVHSIAYDLNGNILKMNQMGMKPTSSSLNSSSLIDSLVYGYNSNTNKLNYVTDKVNDTTAKLGDFTEKTNNTSQDYWYDGNGNLTQDNNKSISSIHYNYLNLPDSITFTGKGAIRYIYDASGTKLQKITTDNLANKQTVITYAGSGVYQYSRPLTATGAVAIDTLQYLAQEEGRIRPKTFGRVDTVSYDYFVKDHLGNIRMVLTDEVQSDKYTVASLENATIANERLYYTGVDTGRVNKNTVAGYPTDTYTSPNDYIQKLNGNGPKIGTGILLKVMAGDSILVRANSWYNNTATPNTAVSPLTDIVNALINSVPGASGSKILQGQLNSTVLTPDVNSFLNTRDAGGNTSIPKAWFNVVMLDEQMNPVITNDGRNSYFQQVGASNVFTTHSANRLITKSGYVYIYVSNETPNIDVFFDNLQVTQVRGPLLETDNYYPFGLMQAGISSQAAGKMENKLKYNGKEIQYKEFSDGGGLGWSDYNHRFFDFQLGRFFVEDQLSDKFYHYSPYQFAGNRVPNAIDLDGLEEALTTNRLIQAGIQMGVIGNKRVGELFERTGIAAISDRNLLAIKNGRNYESPARALRNADGLLGPTAVRPDMTNIVGEYDVEKKKAGIGFNQFIEMKATSAKITRSYRQGQMEAMIDVLANLRDEGKISSAELLVVGTADLTFGADFKKYAFDRDVKVSAILTGIDEKNNVYFSDPIPIVNPEGHIEINIWKGIKSIFSRPNPWEGKSGYPLSSFTSGITNNSAVQGGDNVPNPTTGYNNPDNPIANDK